MNTAGGGGGGGRGGGGGGGWGGSLLGVSMGVARRVGGECVLCLGALGCHT